MAPVWVLRGCDDGTRSVVTLLDEGTLEDGEVLVTGVLQGESSKASSAPEGQKNLFGMNRPKHRERSTGGAEPKPGQDARNGRPGPPPM